MTPTDQKPDPAAELAAALTEVPPQKSRGMLELLRMLTQHPEHAPFLKDLIEAEKQRDLFDQDYRQAKMFMQSGQFEGTKNLTPEQQVCTAMAKIRIGREWGMSDSEAMANVYFVNGRPAVMTDYLAGKMQEAGYSWDTEFDWGPDGRCTGCTVFLRRYNPATGQHDEVLDRKGHPVFAAFTEADALRAIQSGRDGKAGGSLMDKQTYKSWPQEMFFWKALGRLRKFHATGVLRGAVQVELARELPPPREMAQIEAGEEKPTEERKPLRERILEAEEPAEETED